MGFKAWLARTFSNPGQYADSFANGLLELSENWALILVAYSGSRNADNIVPVYRFKDHRELVLAGFQPFTPDIAGLDQSNVPEVVKQPLFGHAYVCAAAFFSFVADDAAREYMRKDNAEQFGTMLAGFVATKLAGRYGLDTEPRLVFERIQQLTPGFVCNRMLNIEDFGNDDGLGKVLQCLRFSPDGKIAYGVVVGSSKQQIGCGTQYTHHITSIRESVKRGAHEIGW